MARGEKIDDESLKALISDEIRSAVTYDETELSEKRARAMEYYQGIMKDTPSAKGRSTFVSMDIADTIGWMLPGIVRVFTASDRMAEYEPTEPGDEEAAQQATDYCNYIFWKDNPGYRILWDATHDSLLQADGIVKHWWDDKEECSYSEHSGLTEEQIALLQQDEGDIEIVAQKPGEAQRITVPDEMGQPVEQEIQTYDVKLKRVTRRGRVRVECIKPEDFLIDSHATTVEDARFVAHRDEVSRSDLIEMGFERELVGGLSTFSFSTLSEEKLAREDEYVSYNDVGHESTHVIELYECYIKADADGDGISETIRAYYAGEPSGGELLDWEVWDDDVPFSDIPCEPVPHRWESRSVADETIDIQRVKTVLTRQMLDNLYWVNNPLNVAEEGSVTNPEMMRAPVFGGTLLLKKGTAFPPTPLHIPFIGDKALTGLQHFDDVREMRTGVARSTMALDPQALTNQTATADQNQRDASYSQIELIARNQAELGWRRVFRQILKLVIKHQDRPRTIRLRDEWVEMDPRHWNADMDCTINVGLGTGSRDRDMSMLKTILETQIALTDRLAGGGFMDKALEMMPRVRNTLVKLAESAGLKNPEMYYPEIDEESVEQMKQQAAEQASQPDPKVQMEQAKLEADMQRGQAEMEMDGQKAQMDIILQREKMAGELELKREQLIAEMQLKREQLSAELMLKRELSMAEMEMKKQQGFYAADRNAEVGRYKADASTKTSGVHPGGEPG